jgi:hypothetical protein
MLVDAADQIIRHADVECSTGLTCEDVHPIGHFCSMDCRVKPGNDELNPHRHQHVEGALAVLVLHQGRRTGVGEPEHGDLALDLRGDVEQIA